MKNESKRPNRHLLMLVIGALGVVYGDIGTSPLYALRECFHGVHAVAPTRGNVLGVLSLVFWSITLLVSVKYLSLVLRADNKGEGGILALLSLAVPEDGSVRGKVARWLIVVGLFGTALLYGDGIITPAVSVLSAVEGLKVATSLFEPFIVPITVVILVLLFSLQRFGTGPVGRVFGLVTAVWFLALAVLGAAGIRLAPEVLWAVNPVHGLHFFLANGASSYVVLGSVFLAVTGAEALYADMGHFGRRPIRLAWFSFVLPALLLNYFGQGALLLHDPGLAAHPFFFLAPRWALYPVVILATSAAVIASQALISGAFSLSMQAVQLGYFPRLRIDHTSSTERGQIYVPHVNWFLMVSCIGIVVGFRSSSNLASAYGVAVTLTMVITTCLFYVATRRLWGWNRVKAALVCFPFLVLELSFFGANAAKITHGGWLPILIGLLVFTLLTTWRTGRVILGRTMDRSSLPLELFFQEMASAPPARVKGTAVYLSGRLGVTPISLLHNLKHNRVLHERVIILTLLFHDRPYIADPDRLQLDRLNDCFYRVTGHYGFMESPDVPALLKKCRDHGLDLNPGQVSYFLSKETILPASRQGMMLWREKLFAVMSRNATSAAGFFGLPPNRVVELGMQVEI